MYRNYRNKVLTENDVDKMLSNYPKTLTMLFEKKFQEQALRQGKNLIDFEIAKQQIKRFLLQEKKDVKRNKIEIVELEKVGDKYLDIDGIDFKIKLKGTVDRVDLFNDKIRIIDYKTGKVEAKQLKIPKDWADFTEDYKYSKAFQVLFYALLKEDNLDEGAEAGIVSFKNLKTGFMTCTDSSLNLKEMVAEFKIELETLILEILNSEIPFTEKLV